MNKENLANSLVVSLVDNELTVTTGEGVLFPTAPFHVTVSPAGVVSNKNNSEIIRVDGVTGDVFTITRAQRGTSEQSIEAGWVIGNGVYVEDVDAKADSTTLTDSLPDTVGSNGQVLKSNGSSVEWQSDQDTTYSEISTAEIDAGTATTARAISGRRAEYIKDAAVTEANSYTDSEVGTLTSTVSDLSDEVDLKADKSELLYAPNPYIEGVNLYSIGHSFTNFPYNHSSFPYTSGHALRIRERLRLGDFYHHGRGGTWSTDMLARLLSPAYDGGSGLWTPSSKGIVLIENYLNEIGYTSAGDTLTRNMIANSIRGEIAVANSKTFITFAENSGTTGTWNTSASNYTVKGMGGVMRVNPSSDAGTVDFTIAQGDEVWVACAISTSAQSITAWTASCNGNNLLTFDGNGLKAEYDDAVLGTNLTLTTRLVKVTGLNSAAGTTGSKTLRITGVSGGNTIISGVVVPNLVNPPRVFLSIEPPRGNPEITTSVDNQAYFASLMNTIAGEFTNVHVVNHRTDWDTTTMLTSDDLHPNDKGQSKLADNYVVAINSNITSWDAGVASLT